MNEIVRVILENEMDLILAHKQSMKLAELCGLTLSAQTSFATAVSEVSRNVIDEPKNAYLVIGVTFKKNIEKYIVATIHDGRSNEIAAKNDGYQYAKRLVEKITRTVTDANNQVELRFKIPHTTRIDNETLEKWGVILNTDPAVSPYEEIKRKNRLLLQMADKLKDSEQSYVTLTDSLPLFIYSINNEGHVIYANKWALDYTGHSIESLNKSRWTDVLHEDDYDASWNEWENSLTNNVARNALRRLRNKSTGEYRWHTGIVTPIFDDKGNVLHWNSFLVDVDAQKKMEQALQDNRELTAMKSELEEKVAELHASNQELEQFAYIASHDLQEPLRKISFYSDYLLKKLAGTLTGENALFLTNITNASDRMRQLINDVLAYSIINKNDDFIPVDLNVVGQEAINDLEIAIKEKNAVVTIASLPHIEANPAQIKQLFENLISNSLKFTEPGIITKINITAETDDNWVTLHFEDNGIGFEDKYIHKMFDLFQRLHTRDKYAGTGIGLGICKKIVTFHNGTISAAGQLGKGAVFTVKLPLVHNSPEGI